MGEGKRRKERNREKGKEREGEGEKERHREGRQRKGERRREREKGKEREGEKCCVSLKTRSAPHRQACTMRVREGFCFASRVGLQPVNTRDIFPRGGQTLTPHGPAVCTT